MNTNQEIKLRLICLILAKGNINKAKNNYLWLNSGIEPIKNRIKIS